MNYDLALTPAGRLHLREGDDDSGATPDAWMKRVAAAFSSSHASGLFALAATRPDAPSSPLFSFWRDFACRYLTQLCRTPESVGKLLNPVEPPFESELAVMLLSAPPMQGGEYLNTEVFRGLWVDLDSWVQKEISASKDGLSGWLKKSRSCFFFFGEWTTKS